MSPWVTRLLVANVVMHVVRVSVRGVLPMLWLVPVWVLEEPWRVVNYFTYMFLHGDLWHLAFNMIALYFFGPRLELRLGGPRFLVLYFVSGLVGGLFSTVFAPATPIIGASGAVFGVLIGFALYWPREPIYIWALVPIEARWLVIIMTGLALFGGFTGFQGNIAHFAHLGGFAGGFGYLKWLEARSPARKFRREAEPARRKSGGGRADLERWSRIDRDDMHPVNRAELDRVMQKIESKGPQSLTPEERAFLDRFSPE